MIIQTRQLSVHVDCNDGRQWTETNGDLPATVSVTLAVKQHVPEVQVGPEHAVRKHSHRHRLQAMSVDKHTSHLLLFSCYIL